MARETKQERIIRSINDHVSEHLHELKALAANPTTKELDIERWCQSVLKSCLGFSATNGYTIMAQETRGKMRPDLIVSKNGSPVFVVEIKRLGFDLDKTDFRSGKIQLSEYLYSLGNVRWGILCNGYEWRLFDFSEPELGGLNVVSFDLRNENEEIDLTKRAIDDTCWDFLDLHETAFSNKTWEELSKESNAFSPESLARAILSSDVVKYIAKVIRGEHEYRANTEVLIDKVYHLLENGLDDSVVGWSEVKQLELNKYIKSQKRVGRRKTKRSSKEADSTATALDSASPDTTVTISEPKKPDEAA